MNPLTKLYLYTAGLLLATVAAVLLLEVIGPLAALLFLAAFIVYFIALSSLKCPACGQSFACFDTQKFLRIPLLEILVQKKCPNCRAPLV